MIYINYPSVMIIKRLISTEFLSSQVPTKWQRFKRRYFQNGKYVFYPKYHIWSLKTVVWGVIKEDGWFYPFPGQHCTWGMYWPYGINNIKHEIKEVDGEKVWNIQPPKYKQFADLF